jgi:hypothetical protein
MSDPGSPQWITNQSGLCCGRHIPAWKGKPFANGCILCDQSPSYWRKRQATANQRIYFKVPGVEDLTTVVGLLDAAGATITSQHREFVVEATLTPRQAAAAWQLTQYVDSGTERARIAVRIEPDIGLDYALAAMCHGRSSRNCRLNPSSTPTSGGSGSNASNGSCDERAGLSWEPVARHAPWPRSG